MTELLQSKRVRIALGALVLWAAGRFGLDLDPGAVDRVIDLAMVVIASFGLSGFGKEKSAQELEAVKTGGLQIVRLETTTIPPPMTGQPSTSPPLPPLPPGWSHKQGITPTTADGMSGRARVLRDEARRGKPEEKP